MATGYLRSNRLRPSARSQEMSAIAVLQANFVVRPEGLIGIRIPGYKNFSPCETEALAFLTTKLHYEYFPEE